MFEAKVHRLYDAQFAVKERERLDVHRFATYETDGLLADVGVVL